MIDHSSYTDKISFINNILYVNNKIYTGWYKFKLTYNGQDVDKGSDEYYINGKLSVMTDYPSGKYIILIIDSKVEVNSRSEAERALKLLAFI